MPQEINNFTLQRHDGPYENWPMKTKLFYDGKYIGKEVSEYVIEAQFISKYFYLLINSYNCPYEEASNFILLNK